MLVIVAYGWFQFSMDTYEESLRFWDPGMPVPELIGLLPMNRLQQESDLVVI